MSWSRFFWDGSEVYTFPSSGPTAEGHYECCGCYLNGHSWKTLEHAEFVAHLDEHRAAGHEVPDYAYEGAAQWYAEHHPPTGEETADGADAGEDDQA